MTGEVRSLETTINVTTIFYFYYFFCIHADVGFQNFFTNVSALLSQANADGTKSDGYHHYETPERELRAA
jgi:cysteinyl-tRNA synthetase